MLKHSAWRLGPPSRRVTSMCAASLIALLGGATVEGGPGAIPASAPPNGEIGFVLSVFAPSVVNGKENCPNGPAGTVRENYLETLPETERTRLLLPANEVELTRRWKTSGMGPNNTNLCSNPEMFERANQRTVTGKVSRGLNLDDDTGNGSSNPDSCVHENFVGANGEAGVDNQAYRALGCTRQYRSYDGLAGDIVNGYNKRVKSGETTMVILIRNVQNLRNDDSVEVVMATTGDRPVLDSRQNFIPDVSYSVSDNPRWRNVLRGRIINGVLMTEPAEITLSQPWGQAGTGTRGNNMAWTFKKARMRLELQPGGGIKGVLGGYEPIRTVIQSSLAGGLGVITVGGIDCAANFHTLRRLADGIKDPRTGQCTAVSSGYDVEGVPAFVNDRPPSLAPAGGQTR